MSDIVETVTAEYEAAVERWRAKVAEFQSVFAEFLALQSDAVATGFGAEWNELYSKAQGIQSTLTYIANGLSSIYGWVQDVFGLGGLRGLGVIPMIPIAVVTGSIAALAYFISDLIKFNQKIALAKAAGYTPGQTSDLLESGGLVSQAFSRNLMFAVLLGGAALYFIPRLMDKRR